MRTVLALAVASALMFGCGAPVGDEAGATNDALTADADRNFHPTNQCYVESPYTAEIDLSDRANPKYRIRHSFEVAERGKQNINLQLRDGSRWESPDDLVSRRSSADWDGVDVNDGEAVRRRTEQASARDPWDPLPVPKEFLDKAFEVNKDGLYNLQSWEVIINVPWISLGPDPVCRHDFYYAL